MHLLETNQKLSLLALAWKRASHFRLMLSSFLQSTYSGPQMKTLKQLAVVKIWKHSQCLQSQVSKKFLTSVMIRTTRKKKLRGDIYSSHVSSTNKLEYGIAERLITNIQTQRIGHKKEVITVKIFNRQIAPIHFVTICVWTSLLVVSERKSKLTFERRKTVNGAVSLLFRQQNARK